MKRFFVLILTLSLLLMSVGCGRNTDNPGNDRADEQISSSKENTVTENKTTENEANENEASDSDSETPIADAGTGELKNLMDQINARDLEMNPDVERGNIAVTEFGIDLLKRSMVNGENVLISPLSVLSALVMTANGAREETLAQMEDVFGMSVEELNCYLCWYLASLPQGENYTLHVANSIWMNDHLRFTPRQEFLQTNADYFGADIYTLPFDLAALDMINGWVNEKTEGMIPEVLDRIPPEALVYLVNALAFEAQWRRTYDAYQVYEGVFTKEDGTTQTVELMYSVEQVYVENEEATGFIKHYEDHAYAFVGLLPREGVSVEELVASLSGERLSALLDGAQYTMVDAAIPKFEVEYGVDLVPVLKNMGMVNAVDEELADFTGMGTSTEGNLFIGRVLHKTFISVGEQGTKAGAVTVVEVPDSAGVLPDEMQIVYLDRPFVYLLIDCESGVPFFIGVMAGAEQ